MQTITITTSKGRSYFGNSVGETQHSAGSIGALCKLLLEKGLATLETPVHCVTDTGTVIWKDDYSISHFIKEMTEMKKDKTTNAAKPKTDRTDLTPVANSEPVVLKTKAVWAVADEMPTATRAEVVAECVKRGINRSTASVQWGLWSKARAAA